MKGKVLLAGVTALFIVGSGTLATSVNDVGEGSAKFAHQPSMKQGALADSQVSLDSYPAGDGSVPSSSSNPSDLASSPSTNSTDSTNNSNPGRETGDTGGSTNGAPVPAPSQKPTAPDSTSNSTAPAPKWSQPTKADATKTNINYWNHLPAEANTGKNVVLTFDDGPSPWTAQLIKTLDEQDVPAVMFWNTYHISLATDSLYSLLKSSPNVRIGNHTADHPNLLNLGYEAQSSEILNAQKILEQKTNQPVVFFRPPYGNYNSVTERVLNEQHLVPVMWNVDSLDWKYNSDKAAILAEIKRQLKPGAIILMHDHFNTVKYLPDIIAMLREQGYGFTTLAKQ